MDLLISKPLLQIPYKSYFDSTHHKWICLSSLIVSFINDGRIIKQHTWMDLLISKLLLQIPYTSSFDLCTLVLSLVASLMMVESSNSTQHKWICSSANPCCNVLNSHPIPVTFTSYNEQMLDNRNGCIRWPNKWNQDINLHVAEQGWFLSISSCKFVIQKSRQWKIWWRQYIPKFYWLDVITIWMNDFMHRLTLQCNNTYINSVNSYWYTQDIPKP